ncbi:Chromodomain-helicase-DNA-binding protein 4 [Sesamum angolense]|uniref:Chromodomain-helicase-DNA-binding protein 4 n=1 Tax=Sesamum angolense TaxID=2727404 RepID=A0AAE2BNT9_9LAMI|nr:Chromodomain-helicase-DNA-binding protein 4 [Sesamum angolense]
MVSEFKELMRTKMTVNPDNLEINPAGGAEFELRANEAGPCELNCADKVDHNLRRVRVSEANGFVVYTRNKRLKRRKGEGVSINEALEVVRSNNEGGNMVGGEGEMLELEMKEDGVAKMDRPLEFTGAGELKSEKLEASSRRTKRKMGMEMFKDLVSGHPTTANELLQTGLLEGYSVFYDGGERGFELRGTIHDSGILCTCRLCKGATVVSPRQFEIHACNTYRCASQHICFENGKSLLDVVKEVRVCPNMTLEEAVQSYAGPAPRTHLKKQLFALWFLGSFLAPFVAKVKLLCSSCKIAVNSDSARAARAKFRHSELKSNAKSLGTSSSRLSARKKVQQNITRKLSRRSSAPKLHENALARLLKRSSSFKRGTPFGSVQSKSSSKITRKDQGMHKLVFDDGGLPDGTKLAYYANGEKFCAGVKIGSGILCHCCDLLVSPSQFEAHAGWAFHRKPYMYIYTSNGVSLHEFTVSVLKGGKRSIKESDGRCIVCARGGDLVLCDACPRAFHKECASLSSVRCNKWYCTYCEKMFRRERHAERSVNAIAAGRVHGGDPIAQLTGGATSMVQDLEEAEVIACIICRCHDFSTSGFGPRTVIVCDQCEKEHHGLSLKECGMDDLKELPEGKWFCSADCKWIHSILQNLLNAGAEELPDSSLDILKKKNNMAADAGIDVRWRLLRGKDSSREDRALLSQVVDIFHECFDPIIDSETGCDLIPPMVYGGNIRGQDFGGLYCAILTVNSIVVSAGIIRIFGQDMAELPLAATRTGYQGKDATP